MKISVSLIQIVFLVLCLAVVLSGHVQAQQPSSDQFHKKYQDIVQGAGEAVKQGIGQLHDTANSTQSDDARNIRGFVLSTEVRGFKNIPEHLDAEIAQMRKRIKLVIKAAATDIEQTGNSGTLGIDRQGMIKYEELPGEARERYDTLMEASRKNNVSIYSLHLAVKMLADLNKSLMKAAREETQISRKSRLFVLQAAYVYEMADIVLEILDTVGLEGKQDLEQLHREFKTRADQRNQKISNELAEIKQAESKGSISTEYADQMRKGYEHMREANRIGLQVWDDVMARISKQESFLQDIKAKRDMIRFKRNAAKIQLDTLRDLGVLSEAHKVVHSMDELVTTVNDLELLVLDGETVRQLIFGNTNMEAR